MTRTLILLRHAKSAWPKHTPDADRPLAARGHRDAPAAGRWLGEHAPRIDLVVCSTAIRAVQTWELAAAELATTPRVRHDEWLYGASAHDLLTTTMELPSTVSTALLVGHNPALENLLTVLTGVAKPLKTSTIAIMTTLQDWQQSRSSWWTLEALTTPRG